MVSAETTAPVSTNGVSKWQVSRGCSYEERAQKQAIIEECNENWEKWGIIEKPAQDELIDPNSCVDDKRDSINGCAEGLISVPLLLGELSIRGITALMPEDKTSLSYISQHGSLQDMQAYYANDFFRKHCKLAQEDESKYLSENCAKHSVETPNTNCDQFLNEVREARQCRRSNDIRRLYRESSTEILEAAQKLYDNKIETLKLEEHKEQKIEDAKRLCRSILNPYSEDIKKVLFNPIGFLKQEIKNVVNPRVKTINAYNSCIESNITDPEIRDRLERSGVGLIGSIAGKYQSLKCYKSEVQAKIICEIATALLPGGAGSAAYVVKRLGKSSVKAGKSAIVTMGPSRILSSSEIRDHLSAKEFVALEKYTGLDYRRINRYMRIGLFLKPLSIQLCGASCKHLLSALEKLPAYVGRTYRSSQINSRRIRSQFLQKGAVIQDRGFLSTTRRHPGKSKNSNGPQGIAFTIDGQSGRAIENAAQVAQEQEVLFPPNVKFQVKEVTKRKDGSHHVHLVEVDD